MRAEAGRGDRLGEGARQRGHVDQLDPVAEAVLAQPGLGEEGELQRGHGALDRHLGDVDDEAAAVEALERVPASASAPSSV